jgi:hypothetical protein
MWSTCPIFTPSSPIAARAFMRLKGGLPLIRKVPQSQGVYVAPAIAFGASSTHWQRLKPRFAAFWAIEITTEFLLVGMATTAETFVFRCSVIVVHNYPIDTPVARLVTTDPGNEVIECDLELLDESDPFDCKSAS